MFPILDQTMLFGLCLLVAGFLAGAVMLFVVLYLAIQKVWEHFFYDKTELKQEQEQAVAVAKAFVIQHQYDRQRQWKLYMTILVAQAVMIRYFHKTGRDNDSGKGAHS